MVFLSGLVRCFFSVVAVLAAGVMLAGFANSADAKYKKGDAANYHYEYAVKFVCGDSDASVVAPGRYFTAINVHNPLNKKVEYRKKVAVALPGEKPGPISKFTTAGLKYDEALEIDCPDIMKQFKKKSDFLKGFVVIQSPSELDIVAVYTTAEWHVESIHTERVPHRIISKPEQVKVTKVEEAFCPAGGKASQVGQEGCCCNRPKVSPPMSDADWWPDCVPGLVCAGNLVDVANGIQTNTYSTCTRNITSGINPPLHWSQPRFCGQR